VFVDVCVNVIVNVDDVVVVKDIVEFDD